MKYQTFINVNFAESGSGSITAKIPFPISVLKDIEITKEDKTIIMWYDPQKSQITLEKYIPLETFDLDFEYEFVKKINSCYDKIMTMHFEKTGITGSSWTYTRCMGGRAIGKDSCERKDDLLFDNKVVVQVLLQKSKIMLFIDDCFLQNSPYKLHLIKLKKDLHNLSLQNGMLFKEMQEYIDYME